MHALVPILLMPKLVDTSTITDTSTSWVFRWALSQPVGSGLPMSHCSGWSWWRRSLALIGSAHSCSDSEPAAYWPTSRGRWVLLYSTIDDITVLSIVLPTVQETVLQTLLLRLLQTVLWTVRQTIPPIVIGMTTIFKYWTCCFRSTIMQLEIMQTTTNCPWPEDQHYLKNLFQVLAWHVHGRGVPGIIYILKQNKHRPPNVPFTCVQHLVCLFQTQIGVCNPGVTELLLCPLSA